MGSRKTLLCTALVLAAALRPVAAFEDDSEDRTNRTFEVVDLGVLPGATTSVANAISDEGVIAGASGPGAYDQQHAVIWNKDRRILDIHPQGLSWSQAYGVNDHGQVAGQACCVPARISGERQMPFLWSSTTGIRELANVGYGINSAAAINDPGQVAGQMMTLHTMFGTGSVYWTPDGALHELGPFDRSSSANSVNESGQMAGSVDISVGTVHAFLWSPQGAAQDLGTLAAPGPFTYSEAFAINVRGDVVGSSTPAGAPVSHGFLWAAATGMRDIGTLGADSTIARGINAHGEVVGYAYGQAGTRAFYWTAKGGMQELPGLGGRQQATPGVFHVSTQANAINDDGMIVGFSVASDGMRHAVLWIRSED